MTVRLKNEWLKWPANRFRGVGTDWPVTQNSVSEMSRVNFDGVHLYTAAPSVPAGDWPAAPQAANLMSGMSASNVYKFFSGAYSGVMTQSSPLGISTDGSLINSSAINLYENEATSIFSVSTNQTITHIMLSAWAIESGSIVNTVIGWVEVETPWTITANSNVAIPARALKIAFRQA